MTLPALLRILPFTVLLAACGASDPDLMRFPATRVPSEFLVAPSKPLETPPDSTALPTPTPGVANRADPTPREDAILALGGRPGAGSTGDAGLLNHTQRFGRDPDIRETLAAEDLAFRRGNRGRILERIAGTNRYFTVYSGQSLDQLSEQARLRAAGVPTASAPPAAIRSR